MSLGSIGDLFVGSGLALTFGTRSGNMLWPLSTAMWKATGVVAASCKNWMASRADPFFNLRPLWCGERYMVRMIIRCQVQEEEMCQPHKDLCGSSLGDSPLRAGGANVPCGYIP
eukprot:s2255_g1.t1